jgi:hypothetical protein
LNVFSLLTQIEQTRSCVSSSSSRNFQRITHLPPVVKENDSIFFTVSHPCLFFPSGVTRKRRGVWLEFLRRRRAAEASQGEDAARRVSSPSPQASTAPALAGAHGWVALPSHRPDVAPTLPPWRAAASPPPAWNDLPPADACDPATTGQVWCGPVASSVTGPLLRPTALLYRKSSCRMI